MTTELQTKDYIETELQKFGINNETLTALADSYRCLTINGIDDREGFKKVVEARKVLKNKRVEIKHNGKTLRESALKFQRAVIARENELVAIIEPVEDELQAEEDRILAEKEIIRQEKEQKEAARVQSRINALAKFNYVIDFYDAKIMPDDKFNELLIHAEEEHKKELERQAEQERLRIEEEQRMRQEREELERMRAEQERIAREQAEREAAIRAEQARKEAELQAEREKFEAEKRSAEEAKRREEMERQRQIELEKARKEAAEKARIEAEQKAKREAEEKAERERQVKIEAERQEALKPDKVKLASLSTSIRSFQLPGVSSNEAKKLIGEVAELLTKVSDHIDNRIIKL